MLTKKIVYAKKKDDDGTHYQLTMSIRNSDKSVCKVMMFNVLDRYGEFYLENYFTLLDGNC